MSTQSNPPLSRRGDAAVAFVPRAVPLDPVRDRAQRIGDKVASPLANQTRMVWRSIAELKAARQRRDDEAISEWREQLEIYVAHARSETLRRRCESALREDDAARGGAESAARAHEPA